uniref:Beta-2-glycoprotein 1 n=1 Tax=Pogona vitticeps TaxID=103695 RepID=A0A6J0US67_9SAUR|nr:beta-2-glycoprotein 1 isoform X1 [Pogona vitticeps]
MTPVLLILWAGALTYPILAAPACSRPPQVPFATVDVFKAEYNVGEEITYQCNPGYIARSGSRKYICPLSGRWPSILLTCIPRKCLYPGPLVNGNIQHTDLSYPNSVNFSCDPGYNLQGPKTSHCQADGQWSAKLPQCQPVICPPPPVSEFSALLYHRFKPGNISVFQDKIKFDCLSPLALIGNEIAFCQADGSWSAIPECRRVECPRPQEIENGFINFALRRSFIYKDTVSYGCNDPYVLEGPVDSRCEKTGQWSAKPTCRASCQIPVKRATVLYNDQKVKVQDHLQNGIRHAETIWFFCKNKEHHCSYTAPAQCIDGVLTPPECFKERSWFASVFKTDIADLTPCENIN